MELFAIRDKKTGQFYGVLISSNDGGESCNPYTAELSQASVGETPWVTTSKEVANKVLTESVAWYNSGMEHPMFSRKEAAHAEVVRFEMIERKA